MQYQFHFGKKFYLDKKTGYWISTTCPKIRAHVWVWESCNGTIPAGYHVHHKDKNKSNNSIENLEILIPRDHVKKHLSEEKRERSRKLMEKVRHLTKEWHASAEGRRWHSEHAIKCSFGKWEKRVYECQVCSKNYETSKRSTTKFCSNACKSSYRRRSRVDEVLRKCKKCGKEFGVNKYAKQKFCGRKCGSGGRKGKVYKKSGV